MRNRLKILVWLFILCLGLAGCSEPKEKKLSTMDSLTKRFHYQEFIQSEGVPVYEGFSVDSVSNLTLDAWPRTGGRGAYIRLHGQQGYTGTYLLELRPGESTSPERHIYEEVIYVLEGSGQTSIWQSGNENNKSIVNHKAQALFSPPMNSWHSHYNSGSTPLKILAFTNAPLVMDFFRDDEFVFDNPHSFSDRWNGDENFFLPGPLESDEGKRGNGRIADPFHVNFVPDIFSLDHLMHTWRKKRMDLALFLMSENSLSPHISSWPARDYQTAHHHNGGATIVLLRGEGYYLMWPRQAGAHPFADGFEDQVVRGELKAGGMYSPPAGWYHQHFNTSSEPALYLALTPQGRVDRLFHAKVSHDSIVYAMEREASASPTLIKIDDEDPFIGRQFREIISERD